MPRLEPTLPQPSRSLLAALLAVFESEAAPPAEDALSVACAGGEPVVACASLLRRACGSDPVVLKIEPSREIVRALLRWVYCGQIEEGGGGGRGSVPAAGDLAEERALIELATSWGLRNDNELRIALVSSFATGRPHRRHLPAHAAALLRAYDAAQLGWATEGQRASRLRFRAEVADGEDAEGVVLEGGLRELLVVRSTFFASLLSGQWQEGSADGGEPIAVTWDADELRRLLRFLHGGAFLHSIEGLEEVTAQHVHCAVGCAEFFGIPDLLDHANDAIAGTLDVRNCVELWNYVASTPALHRELDADEHAVDADDAAFAFFVKNFAVLAALEEKPLQALQLGLMQRLLESGLVELQTSALMPLVAAYAQARAEAEVDVQVTKDADSRPRLRVAAAGGGGGGGKERKGRDEVASAAQIAVERAELQQIAPMLQTAIRSATAQLDARAKELCAMLMPPRVLFNRQIRNAILNPRSVGARNFV